MRSIVICAASALFMLGSAVLVGCDSNSQNAPRNSQATSAGGNGAFGENPVRPGVYGNDTHAAPTTQPAVGQ